VREIKFRAWSPSKKKWRSDWSISSYVEVLDLNEERIDDDLILMQYIGLKDRNSKEIYEGDIIRGLHDFGPGGFHEKIGVIQWFDEGSYRMEYWEQPEVIGNIYENPELLEQPA